MYSVKGQRAKRDWNKLLLAHCVQKWIIFIQILHQEKTCPSQLVRNCFDYVQKTNELIWFFFYNEHFLFWPVSESLDLFNQLSYSFNVSETKTEAGIWGFPMFSGLVGTCGSFRLQTKHQQKQHGRKLELVCLCQSHTKRGVETRAPRLLKPATVTSNQNHSETKPAFGRQ